VPGRKWYLIAGAVFLLGMLLFGTFLFLRLHGLGDELPRFVVPGTSEFQLAEPGTYTIFHETGGVVDGRYYAAADISGLTVDVISAATGNSIPLEPPGASSTYELGGRSGSAILTFEISEPGPYRITGMYPDGRSEPAAVLAVGHNFGRKLVLTIVSGIAIAFGSFALAVLIAAVTFVKRRRARRGAVSSTPASGPVPPIEEVP
jgi:hypothetical protein